MTDTTEDKFIEALGLIWQTEGRPRIAGQILAYLTLSDGPKGLEEIAEALGVSKASVSTNVRLLELQSMTARVSRVGMRRDLWVATPDPQGATLNAMADRFHKHAERIGGIAEDFPEDAPEKRQKVAQFADFYRTSATFLSQWARTLDHQVDGSPAAPSDTTPKTNSAPHDGVTQTEETDRHD